MRLKILLILVAVLSLLVVMASPEADPNRGSSASPSPSACDLYASPSGGHGSADGTRRGRPGAGRGRGGRGGRRGSRRDPFRGVQPLVNALRPGQTGCLEPGTYAGPVEFHHGGQPGRRLTLRGLPGRRATLGGGPVTIPAGSNYVTIAALKLVPAHTAQVGVQIMGNHVALIGDDITNHSSGRSCIILGNNDGWGRALGTLIVGNVIHDCGSRRDGNQDHALYFDNSSGAVAADNVIWGTSGFAIHLYQHAVDNAIVHNVIYGNGHGVIFAGSSDLTSSGNVVAYNIIGRTMRDYDVSSWWGGRVGSGNLLRSNCLYSGDGPAIVRPTTGFRTADNLIARPGFVNARRHDYLLRPHSPCLKVIGYDSVPVLRRLQRGI